MDSSARNGVGIIGITPRRLEEEFCDIACGSHRVLHSQLRRPDPLVTVEPAFPEGIDESSGQQSALNRVRWAPCNHHLRDGLGLETEMVSLGLRHFEPAGERFDLASGAAGKCEFLTVARGKV